MVSIKFTFILILTCLPNYVSPQGDGTVLRAKACTRVQNDLSNFITCTQVNSVAKALIGMLSAGQTATDVINSAQSTIMGSFTASQNGTVIAKGAGLIFSVGPSGIITTINTVGTVVRANSFAFATQLENVVKQLKADGIVDPEIHIRKVLYYFLQFMSQDNICLIMQRFKNNLNKPSWWSAITSAFSTIIRFNKCTIT
uniref:Secreted protein n=1 Tax=Rhabditophanes sp. KR3021 TaxID=114890 RepID=A0AC35TXT3_9BILA